MSEKWIADKLLIKPNSTVWLSDPGYADRLGPLPAGARLVESLGEAAVAVAVADSEASVREVLKTEEHDLLKPGAFWVAYPKANRTDINRDSLWPIVAEYGMRPVTQVSVDDVWSALRFRALKPGEEQFRGGGR
jgi:hypothetical protein